MSSHSLLRSVSAPIGARFRFRGAGLYLEWAGSGRHPIGARLAPRGSVSPGGEGARRGPDLAQDGAEVGLFEVGIDAQQAQGATAGDGAVFDLRADLGLREAAKLAVGRRSSQA